MISTTYRHQVLVWRHERRPHVQALVRRATSTLKLFVTAMPTLIAGIF